MGTGGPPVTVRAATLAGGENNQDRYAHGDGWAFVLDGASSFATEQPEHDGGWYAERLKNALVHELTAHPDDATADIVARAIGVAASAHADPETCPTSTIALARWSAQTVETYVLGDSPAVLITADGTEEVLTDSRISAIAPDVRAEYRSRLTDGHGFDNRHRRLLQELQARQAASRNRPEGYWIAGAEPLAAYYGLRDIRPVQTLRCVALASDGAAAGQRYGSFPTWSAFASSSLRETLLDVRSAESADRDAFQWPRSKAQDDKTVIMIWFTYGAPG